MTDFIKSFHFLVLHFPIALLILSFVLDLIATIWRKSSWHKPLHNAGFIILILGTLSGIATVVAGFITLSFLPSEFVQKILPHETRGIMTTLYFVLLSGVRMYFKWNKKNDIGDNLLYLIASLVGAYLVFNSFRVTRYGHFAFLQFTVPVIICGFLADIAAIFGKNKEWRKPMQTIGFYFLLLGTISIILTVISGFIRADQLPAIGRKFDPASLAAHEQSGIITMIFFILLSLFRGFFYFKGKAANVIKGQTPYIIGAVVGIAVISWASHLGGTVRLLKAIFGA